MSSSDINLQPVSPGILDARPTKILPIYLISFTEPSQKVEKVRYFLSTKMDQHAASLETSGFFVEEGAPEEIFQNAAALFQKRDRTTFRQIWIPMHRLVLIENTSFRAKAV